MPNFDDNIISGFHPEDYYYEFDLDDYTGGSSYEYFTAERIQPYSPMIFTVKRIIDRIEKLKGNAWQGTPKKIHETSLLVVSRIAHSQCFLDDDGISLEDSFIRDLEVLNSILNNDFYYSPDGMLKLEPIGIIWCDKVTWGRNHATIIASHGSNEKYAGCSEEIHQLKEEEEKINA